MYNIDFKVSGHIVSISIDSSDTVQTLTIKMKQLSPFKKYNG